jgi:hypothetical protein
MFRRCAARAPQGPELSALTRALTEFRERFRDTPADAEGLLKKGQTPVAEGTDRPELAAWTMIASAILDLYETTTQE